MGKPAKEYTKEEWSQLKETIQQDHAKNGASSVELEKKYGIKSGVIRKWIKFGRSGPKPSSKREILLDDWVKSGDQPCVLANRHGVVESTARYWIIKERKRIEATMGETPVGLVEEAQPLPAIDIDAVMKAEFFAEYMACDGDLILAASRVGIDQKAAGRMVIEHLKNLEKEVAIKKKNPPQKMAPTLPSHWKTKKGAVHLVIPDVQAKPGQCFEFLRKIGLQAAKKRPDVIVCIGDFWDFPSLSSYDRGKLSSHGRAYEMDVKAGKEAMAMLMAPILAEMAKSKEMDATPWAPLFIYNVGNHEHRIHRAVDEFPALDGWMSIDDLGLDAYGWNVYPFLEVVNVDGINYSHYITTGVMGRPASSARAMLMKKHQSCVMGHVQKDDIATEYTFDGKLITGIFVGCAYEHDEDYLGPQGNNYFRGIWMFYEVDDGAFHPVKVPLSFLHKKFA